MRNKQNFLDATLHIASCKWFPLVFIPIALIFLLIYSHSTSPLFVYEGMDSSVFKTMGLAILEGKTPYVDFFDHKGPILYFINALGQLLIPGRAGIFLLQVAWLSLSLFFLFNVATIFIRSDAAFLSVMLSLLIFMGCIEDGNQCEEWELLAISASIFYATRYVSNPNPNAISLYSFIWGLCFAYIFYIRPNDAVAQIGGIMIGIAYILVNNKDIMGLIKSTCAFTGGALLVSFPIVFFFASRHAVSDLIYGLVYHNALYSCGVKRMLLSCLGHTKLCFFLLFVPTGCIVYHTKFKNILCFLIPLILLSLFLTGPNGSHHYYIPFIPLFVLFWAFLFLNKSVPILLISLSMFYCCSYGSAANYLTSIHEETISRINTIRNRDSESRDFYQEAEKLVNLIPINERNNVWNYNLMWEKTPDFSVLYHFGIVQCNKVPLYKMYMVNPRLKEEDDIKLFQPKWIFLSHESDSMDSWYHFSSDYEYINRSYTLIGSSNADNCDIELYHKNK